MDINPEKHNLAPKEYS